MKNLSRVLISLLFFLFLTEPILAGDLLIVEIQIAGEKSSYDFIKIYNLTNSDIYLGNYQGSYLRLVKRTKTSSKDYTIKSWSKDPQAKIPAGGFYVWANKDYTTLSNVNTFTSQTIAENSGIALRLGQENTGIIIDAVGWGDFNNILFEGTPFPKNPNPNQRLKRKQIAGIYQDTNNNSKDFYLTPPFQQESKTGKTKPISCPSGIVINEIFPSPKRLNEREEWIEIFNQNDFEIDLSGWQITDKKGKTRIFTFPEGTKISARGFLTFSRTTTKITLNNEGDILNLICPNGKIIDSVSYEKAIQDQSYNRFESGWVWSSSLTPGFKNITKEIKSSPKTKELVGTVKQISKEKFSFFPLIIALSLAILSAITILILKNKLKKIDFSKKLE